MSSQPAAIRPLPGIVVSAVDHERITSLLDTLSDAKREQAEDLESELARAEVVRPISIGEDGSFLVNNEKRGRF